MSEKKEEAFKDIKGYLKNFIILFLCGIPLYFELSIARLFFKTQNEKIIWLIDLGFYNMIFSIIVALIIYFSTNKRTNLNIKLYHTDDKLSNVSLENHISKTVYLEITVKGDRNNIPDKIVINYPNGLDLQIKGANYLKSEDSLNQYHFDLQKMFNKQKSIDLTQIIPIDITGYSEAKSEITIIPEIAKMELKLRLFLNIKLKGLKIKFKGN